MTRIKYSIIVLLALLTSCSDFDKKGKPLFKDLNNLFELSSFKCETIENVWTTAIYDKRYALSTSDNYEDRYVYDFNEALQRMEKDSLIITLNNKINSLNTLVTKEAESISDKKHESYDKLISLYTNVIELSKMAKSPSGSLQSFRTDLAQKKNQINLLITEIKARKPDFKE